MKFNVEIDLDWIEEDSSIDQEVKSQIIDHIEEKVFASLKAQVTDKLTSLIVDNSTALSLRQ